jgi:micrococcal nuclease
MVKLKRYGAIFAVIVTLAPVSAAADPCTAKLPKPRTAFMGTVRYVGDGDSLCVGNSTNPKTWIEVRVADFYAPELRAPGGKEAKSALERIAMGKPLHCTAGKRSYDRVVATCTLAGYSLENLMRLSGVAEGGRGKEAPKDKGSRRDH